VNRVLEMSHVVRVVTLGPTSDDLAWPELKLANLPAVASGRLEVYPWQHAPSRVLGTYASTPCSRMESGRLVWTTLAAVDWTSFLSDCVARLPTAAVWLTIDKDVLTRADAVTNWDQGGMPLDNVLQAIKLIGERKRLLGVDICGDYSPRVFVDPLRAVLAHLDSPEKERPTVAQLAVNECTNGRILDMVDRMAETSKGRTDA
jgi:hypothetical protein